MRRPYRKVGKLGMEEENALRFYLTERSVVCLANELPLISWFQCVMENEWDRLGPVIPIVTRNDSGFVGRAEACLGDPRSSYSTSQPCDGVTLA